MSRRIQTFSTPARYRRYPWDEWLDGSIWRIKRGQDFTVDRSSMRTMIYTNATKRGAMATIHYVDEDTLEFQARA